MPFTLRDREPGPLSLTPRELERLRLDPPPVSAAATRCRACLDAGRAVWIVGAPGTGRTHCLLEVWMAREAELVVALDLAVSDGRPPAGRLGAAVAEAAGLPEPLPAEWLAWLDRGEGSLHRPALEEASLKTHGTGLHDLRRRHGVDVLVGLLADYGREHFLPPPDVLPPAEKLAALYDLRGEHGPITVLLDNADAVPTEQLHGLLSALADELPRVYGQDWRLVAAAAVEPVGAPRLELVELPAIDPDAVAWWLADPPVAPRRLARPSAWALLAGLARGAYEPLLGAGLVLRELLADGVTPPYGAADLLASPTVQEALSARLPECAGALDRSRVEIEKAGLLLLARAAAGLAPAMPIQELAAELGVGDAALGELLATADGLSGGPVVRWEPGEPDEVRFDTVRRDRACRVTAAECRAERSCWIEELVTSMDPTVVWENVSYTGEAGAIDAADLSLAGLLPSGLPFRLAVQRSSHLPQPRPALDARVVVLVPAAPSPEQTALLVNAAAVRAVAQSDDPAVRARATAWLADSAGLRNRAAQIAILSGDAVADPPLIERWPESLASVEPERWPAALFRGRFRVVHQRRGDWLDGDLLDEPLTPEALAEVWAELAAAPRALGSPIRQALHLSGEREPAGFAELRRAVAEHGGSLDLPPVLARLCAAPYGLTQELAKLFLLAFMLRAEPPLALEVTGERGGLRRLATEQVRLLSWGDIAPTQLRRLVRADRRGWQELLPFARALESDLGAGSTPSAVAAGRLRLQGALGRLKARTTRAAIGFERLATSFGQAVPADASRELTRLAAVAIAEGSEAMDELLDEEFGGDLHAWTAAVTALDRWEHVLEAAEPLADLARYLAEVILPAHHSLEADRLALRGQLDLARLLQSPNLIRGLLANGDHFRRQFQAAYEEAHRLCHEALGELRLQWEQVSEQHLALARLNRIRALGDPDAAGAGPPIEALEAALRPCHAVPDASSRPVCASCGWRFGDSPPYERFEAVRNEVATGFAARTRRLAGLLTEEIVDQLGADRLEALHQVLTLQQAARIPSVLTAETIELLERCLPSTPSLLAELRRRWPRVSASTVPQVLDELEALLRRAIEEAGGEISL